MVQLLRAHPALSGNLSSLSSTPARQIDNPCNSSSGGLDALFWLLQVLYLGALYMYAPFALLPPPAKTKTKTKKPKLQPFFCLVHSLDAERQGEAENQLPPLLWRQLALCMLCRVCGGGDTAQETGDLVIKQGGEGHSQACIGQVSGSFASGELLSPLSTLSSRVPPRFRASSVWLDEGHFVLRSCGSL